MASPALSAMMCDGLGVFTDLDYKRALLLYDHIYYLIPENTVDFLDEGGHRQSMLYRTSLYQRSEFEIYHYAPPPDVLSLLLLAARADVADANYASALSHVSLPELAYTWRVVNSDGALGGGESIRLGAEERPLAQAILLNKFMLAADSSGCIPIAGRDYVDRLIQAKCLRAQTNVKALAQATGSQLDPHEETRHFAVARAVIADLVADADLNRRSFDDILGFRRANRDLFEQFSLSIRRFVEQITAMPAGPDFDSQLSSLLATSVWEAQKELEETLRSRWRGLFRSALEEGSKSEALRSASQKVLTGLVVGVVPALTLGPLTVASAAMGLSAAAPWVIHTLLEYLAKGREVHRNGLYYLHKFVRS